MRQETGITMYGTVASQLLKGNILNNGNFENAPTFVAIQTQTGSRFNDGTVTGSATGPQKNWSAFINVSGAVFFDSSDKHSGNYSLKLSTTGAGAYIEVFTPTITNGLGGYYAKTKIPVLPSTTYNYSYWAKTNYVSGDSSDGFRISFLGSGLDGLSSGFSRAGASTIKTTTAWTQYSGSFTTNATTYFLQVNPLIYGHTGVATLIMDAWIDDIVIERQ